MTKTKSQTVRFWWKCLTCGGVGLVALPGRSRSDRLITEMEKQHTQASPNCPRTRGKIQDEYWENERGPHSESGPPS